MSGGFKIATVRGVPVVVHYTAAILALFVAYAWSAGARDPSDRVVIALVAVVGVFASILLHELGHVVAALLFGVRASEVSLWGLGGMARFATPMPSPLAEIVVSGAGPLVSLGLGYAFYYLTVTLVATDPSHRVGLGAEVAWGFYGWNVLIGIFNLAPGPPLDGGGIVRGLAWAVLRDRSKAARVSAILGIVTAVAAIVLAVAKVPIPGLGYSPILYFWVAALLALGSWPILRRPQPAATALPESAVFMARAREIAAGRGDPVVGSTHVFLALLESSEEPLASILRSRGLSYAAAIAQIPPPAQPVAEPQFSLGAKQLYEEGLRRGKGGVGLLLALPTESEAGHLATRMGCGLDTLKADLLGRLSTLPPG